MDEVTFGYNITRDEELIDFNKNRREVFNQIRGLNPFPGSYFKLNGKVIKVYEVKEIDDNSFKDKKNGEIVKVDNNSFYIKVIDGLIQVLEIKLEGKKKMLVRDFLNGNKENIIGVVANEK